MSLSSIKAKEIKGKNDILPKFTSVLGDPYKKHCPVLSEDELKELRKLLEDAISTSNDIPRAYATKKQIRLGLESSLRAINQCKSSFVLISLSLKPHHLISLIARNSELKSSTVPVYAQPKLEEFTADIFGVSALSLVLPKNLENISTQLKCWVEARNLPKIIKTKPAPTAKKVKKLQTPKNTKATESPKEVAAEKSVLNEEKQWSGDFISFGNDAETVKLNNLHLNEEKTLLTKTLNRLAEKAKAVPMEVVEEITPQTLPTPTRMEQASVHAEESEEDTDDENDFLEGAYRPLTVLHMLPNPNKKPKKKRKKNKHAKQLHK